MCMVRNIYFNYGFLGEFIGFVYIFGYMWFLWYIFFFCIRDLYFFRKIVELFNIL